MSLGVTYYTSQNVYDYPQPLIEPQVSCSLLHSIEDRIRAVVERLRPQLSTGALLGFGASCMGGSLALIIGGVLCFNSCESNLCNVIGGTALSLGTIGSGVGFLITAGGLAKIDEFCQNNCCCSV